MTDKTKKIVVSSFYRFVSLPDYKELREKLLDICGQLQLKGTILLASEGINSTISGSRENIDLFFSSLSSDPRFTDMDRRESLYVTQPFKRMKVRLKREIIRIGIKDLNMKETGTYVEPEEWEKIINDPDVILVDTRNSYEIEFGKFRGAVNPDTKNFGNFPKWVEENLDPKEHKKVAMYCTGGIRCEKSTALLRKKGFKNVFHLKGGILNYLEKTKNRNKIWEGQCFVFDERTAINEELQPDSQ